MSGRHTVAPSPPKLDTLRAHPPRLYVIMMRVAGTTSWYPWFVTASKREAKSKFDDLPVSDEYDAAELIPYTRARWAEGVQRHG